MTRGAAARPTTFSTSVSTRALEFAAAASERVHARETPIRRTFIRSTEDDVSTRTPMASLLRGGRGGQVRLKLILGQLWIASAQPFDTSFPARAWAELLGLGNPETNGARRIIDAFEWLESHRFVTMERRSGKPARVLLRNERGDGTAYSHPGSKEGRDGIGYVVLPASFWTSGWATVLSGRAVAVFLMLLEAHRDSQPSFWLSPLRVRRDYGLSEDTRAAGVRELVFHKLVTVNSAPVDDGLFGWRRTRNVYRIDRQRLDSAPSAG